MVGDGILIDIIVLVYNVRTTLLLITKFGCTAYVQKLSFRDVIEYSLLSF